MSRAIINSCIDNLSNNSIHASTVPTDNTMIITTNSEVEDSLLEFCITNREWMKRKRIEMRNGISSNIKDKKLI